jgi:pullulanase/glycogen debranching enzyme
LAKLCMHAIIHMGLLLVLDVVYNHVHGTDSRDHHLGSDKVVCI